MTGSHHPTSSLTLRLFGPFDARLHGEPLPRLRSRKGPWLLALLALRHGGEVERTWLAGTLWPDSLESQALANLRISLADVRRALGPEADRLRSPGARTVSLDLAGVEVDVVAFDTAVAGDDLSALERAVALYRGPLLEGCAKEWVLQERSHREQTYLRALERLAGAAGERGEHGLAESYLRRAVTVDPSRESAQRALMEALAASGNYAAATQVYREVRLHLHRELNAEPDAETRALFEQIRAEARQKAASGVQVFRCSGVQVEKDAPSPEHLNTPTPEHRSEATLTFLFTDIAGSTRLWEAEPERMRRALARHDLLLRDAIETHHGRVFKTVGDAFCAVFLTTSDAVDAALAIQRALASETSPDLRGDERRGAGPLRVRVALHAGTAEMRDGDYFGPTLSRAARLLGVAHGGQVLLSGATQELVQDALPPEAALRDLGMQRLRDLQRPERVFQLLHPDLPVDFPPLASLGVLPNNLPQQLTSFVGRERDIAKVKRLLERGSHAARRARLLTLTGVGGTGKTRLALQVAAELLEGERDGVWLVELAPLADPALVPEAVASVLGIREEPGKSIAHRLSEALQPKKLLLLLDNCEHLLSACAELADVLLRGCPGVQILATSREALGIAGEQTYVLPSLSLPEPRDRPAGVEDLAPYEATQLFLERAMASQATFAVTARNAAAVVEICRRLDGIPLAIELAAARVKALPVETINERLDDRFRLLTSGSRTALPRQQTLRALIDWSYDLLTEGERALLRRLSVFAGGFTLEAAEEVCVDGDVATADTRVEREEVLDLLARLVEKSLVQYEEEGGTGRYRLLETVRQYSRDRLLESEEGAAARERHSRYFLQLAEEAEPHLRGAEQVRWLGRLEAEHDNLRMALAWYLPEPNGRAEGREGDAEASLRLVGALWLFWMARSHFREGRQWVEAALGQIEGAAAPLGTGSPPETGEARFGTAKVFRRPSAGGRTPGAPRPVAAVSSATLASLRAWALVGAGQLAWCQADYAVSRRFLEQALVTAREARDTRSIAQAHVGLGLLAHLRSDAPQTRRHAEESLAAGQTLRDPWIIAWSHFILGQASRLEGDDPEAERNYGEGLAIFRQIGDDTGIAWSLHHLGVLAHMQRESEKALSCLEEGEAKFQALGQRWGIAWSLLVRGDAARDRGDLPSARPLLEESLGLFRDLGDRMGATGALVLLGHVAQCEDDRASAHTLYTEAVGAFQELGNRWGCIHALKGLAVLAKRAGDLERAARLWGAAAAVRETLAEPMPFMLLPLDGQDLPPIRAALGEAAFTAAWEAGRAMTLPEAVAYALERRGAA